MQIDGKSFNKLAAIIVIVILLAITFFLLKSIFLAIIAGLIFAYVTNPLYKKINSKVKKPTLSALLVSFIIIIAIVILGWFILRLLIDQVFGLFTLLQGLDIAAIVTKIFPKASESFVTELTSVTSNFISTMLSGSLDWLVNFFRAIPNLLLQGAVFVFVFFFALRDQEKLKEYVSELSPLNKKQQNILIKEFKGITNSIIYGYIIIGIVQGIAMGIGLFVFGVPKALLLTLVAILASIFPLFGPWLVWLPVAAYLFATGNSLAGIIFIAYSAVIVSSLDNILRPYIVSKKSTISPAIALIGMIGGLIVFGLLGLIIGPLILAYLIIFLTAYKNKELSKMFTK